MQPINAQFHPQPPPAESGWCQSWDRSDCHICGCFGILGLKASQTLRALPMSSIPPWLPVGLDWQTHGRRTPVSSLKILATTWREHSLLPGVEAVTEMGEPSYWESHQLQNSSRERWRQLHKALEFSETLPSWYEQRAQFSYYTLGTHTSLLSKYLRRYLPVVFLQGIFIISERLVLRQKKKKKPILIDENLIPLKLSTKKYEYKSVSSHCL